MTVCYQGSLLSPVRQKAALIESFSYAYTCPSRHQEDVLFLMVHVTTSVVKLSHSDATERSTRAVGTQKDSAAILDFLESLAGFETKLVFQACLIEY